MPEGPLPNSEVCTIECGDCRELLANIGDNSIQCVVTSPPYGKLKNYGADGQIGYGQSIEKEYLPALGDVLNELFRVTKEGGAMWVVLDTWKQNGEQFHLPFEFIELAKKSGWTLQDTVMWDKGKTLPWSHNGRFRNRLEYILLFSKGTLGSFNINAARSLEHLSSYWVRYPERYHPLGKAPSDLWHFPIPMQGSWSSDEKRHFCPFPLEMVGRMIALTSSDGDMVLDPFAGTGTVPAVASLMKRKGIGFEINQEFVDNFQSEWRAEISREWDEVVQERENEVGVVSDQLVKLRGLKYPKTLFAGLGRDDRLGKLASKDIICFLVDFRKYSTSKIESGSKYGHANVVVVLGVSAKRKEFESAIVTRVSKPPLSKFGLDLNVSVLQLGRDVSAINKVLKARKKWAMYKNGKFFYRDSRVASSEVLKVAENNFLLNHKIPAIFSNVDLQVSEPSII